MPTVPPLAITDAERAELQSRVRAHTTPSGPPNEPGWCCWPPTACPTARSPRSWA
jgi:hypothetical protein